MRSPNTKLRILIFIALLGIFFGILILFHPSQNNNKKKSPVVVKQYATSYGLFGAVEFSKSVYSSYLQNWDEGDASFIRGHRSWFSERLYTLAKQSKNQAMLFCTKPLVKPDKFIVTASQISPNQFSTVYVNAFKGRTNIVKDLVVSLVPVNNTWVIDGPNCILD